MPTNSRSDDGSFEAWAELGENRAPQPDGFFAFDVRELVELSHGLGGAWGFGCQSGLSVLTSIVPRMNFFVPVSRRLSVWLAVDGFLLLEAGHFGRFQPSPLAEPATTATATHTANTCRQKERTDIDAPSEISTFFGGQHFNRLKQVILSAAKNLRHPARDPSLRSG